MARLDAVIFGATGFTGKHTVINMIEFAKKYQIGSWAVAGRSAKKLDDVMKEVAQKTGADVSGIKSIIADVGDEKSLLEMCKQTKVVINCCGPYRLYGEPVVKAAIESKTNYVDVSGEPQFMELMQLRYNDLAREAGVYVISACGWDCIPADMGVMFLQQNFSGTLNSVRSYLSSYIRPEVKDKFEGRGCVNYGTWESLIHGVTHLSELPALRKQLYPEPLPKLTPKLCKQIIHKRDGKGTYYLPFMGADESVVYRTQRYIYHTEKKRPIQFKPYFKSGNIFSTLFMILSGIALYLLTRFKFTRNILLDYPYICSFGFISKEGPTDAVMNNTLFTFELIGEGWPEGADIDNTKPTKQVIAKVSGSNPGYGATCVALLASARALLHEAGQLPPHGGVYTPGAAFKNTNIIKVLKENNLNYEIVN